MYRSRTLDFFRCVGVLLVLFHHLFKYIIPVHFSFIAFLFVWGGNIGVDLFFVLSGFLIAGLIFKESDKYGSFQPVRFLIRRGFKIYPLYFFTILIGYTAYYFLNESFSGMDLTGEAFFFINYKNSGDPPLGHLWSISVEEHFYFFLSFLLFLLIKYKKLSFGLILSLYLFFFSVGLFSRLFNTLKYTDDFWKISAPSHNRFDSLFFGVLLAYIYNYCEMIVSLLNCFRFYIIAIALFILFQNFNPDFPHKIRLVLLLGLNPICFGLIIFYLFQDMRFEKSKLLNPFVYLGRFSYSIYIFHALILFICYHFFSGNSVVFYLLSVFLSLFIGVMFSKLIERPFLYLRDLFFPSKLSLGSK
jgi:peptidoglycan/LPS O-acetylase OafA/YrhL